MNDNRRNKVKWKRGVSNQRYALFLFASFGLDLCCNKITDFIQALFTNELAVYEYILK